MKNKDKPLLYADLFLKSIDVFLRVNDDNERQFYNLGVIVLSGHSSLTLSVFPSCSRRKTKQYLFPRAGSRPASSVLNTEETGRKKGKERVGKREEASTSLL